MKTYLAIWMLCLSLSFEAIGLDVTIDNLESIKRNDSFILFTIRDFQPSSNLNIYSNNQEISLLCPFIVSVDKKIIKGIIWLNNKGEYVLKRELDIKFQMVSENSNILQEKTISFNKPKTNTDLFPPEIAYEILSILSLPKNPTTLDGKPLSFNLFKQFGEGDIFRVIEQWKSSSNGIGELCSLLIVCYKLEKKESEYSIETLKCVIEKHGAELENPEKILLHTRTELQLLATEERKFLATALKPFSGTFIYLVMYPLAYIRSYIPEVNLNQAEKLYSEFSLHSGFSPLKNSITSEIMELKKAMSNGSDDGLTRLNGKSPYKKIKDILEDSSFTLDEKENTICHIMEINTRNESFSSDEIARIIGELMLYSLLPENKGFLLALCSFFPDKKPNENQKTLTKIENGLVEFYKNYEAKVFQAFEKNKYKSLYPFRRTVPLSVFIQCSYIENNPAVGKELHAYFKNIRHQQNNILEDLKKNDPEGYNKLIKILEQRYGNILP